MYTSTAYPPLNKATPAVKQQEARKIKARKREGTKG